VFPGLSILGNTSLKTSGGGVDDENSAIGLRCTCDHILDEITMPGSIDNSTIVLSSLELPQRNIYCDTTLPLGLELIEHPRVLERALVHLSSLLLKALDHSLVDTPQLVDEMTSGSGLAGVDMSNDHDIDMRLLLSHFAKDLKPKPRRKEDNQYSGQQPAKQENDDTTNPATKKILMIQRNTHANEPQRNKENCRKVNHDVTKNPARKKSRYTEETYTSPKPLKQAWDMKT